MVELQGFVVRPTEVQGRKGGSRLIPVEGNIPLASTLGNIEREIVAGVILLYCRGHGDEWSPVPAPAFHEILEEIKKGWPMYLEPLGNVLAAMEKDGLIIIDRDAAPQTVAATPTLVELIA